MLVHRHRAAAVSDLLELGILSHIVPELTVLQTTAQSGGTVFWHVLAALQHAPADCSPALAWALLLHDLGKAQTAAQHGDSFTFHDHQVVSAELAEIIARRLNFGNRLRRAVIWLVRNHHIFDQWQVMRLATKLQYFDHPQFGELCSLHYADVRGSATRGTGGRRTALRELALIEENAQYARQNKMLPSQCDELLNGREIMQILGVSAGKVIGAAKVELREAQLSGDVTNTAAARKWLIDWQKNS